MKSDLKKYESEMIQFASLNLDSDVAEMINKIQKSALNAMEYALYCIFEELKIEFTVKNLKRITKVAPDKIMGVEKYYLDFGKETEVYLFSSEWEMPDLSKYSNPLTVMHNIKSDFKCIN